MIVDLLRLFFDTGLLVLIWMVQLVIYPSFKYYEKEALIKWHKAYSVNITYIVMPLMLGQLVLAIYQFYMQIDVSSTVYLLLVTLSWISTFLIFVPVHGRISSGNFTTELLQKLVSYNWLRTFIWTLIWIELIIKLFSNQSL